VQKKNEVKNIKIKVIGLISNLNNMIKKYIIIANKFTKKIITKKDLKKKKRTSSESIWIMKQLNIKGLN